MSDEYRRLIKPLQDYSIKHGQTLLLYSVSGKGIGNPNKPVVDGTQKSRLSAEILKHRHNTNFKKIVITLTIQDTKTMLTHHKRSYYIENMSDEPLNEFLYGIATDIEKKFIDLNIRTSDESGKELNIVSINIDKPYQKEFTVLFRKPIRRGEKERSFVLEYDVEEPNRYFENYFGVSCEQCVLSLTFRKEARLNPVLYEVNVENDTKKKSSTQSVIASAAGRMTSATWFLHQVTESQSFRIEW